MSDRDATAAVTERIVFSGRVQGVGFRFTTRSIARQFPVVGYVRNLPDGTVELVIRGVEAAINGLLGRIAEHFHEYVSNISRERVERDESFSHFEIRP